MLSKESSGLAYPEGDKSLKKSVRTLSIAVLGLYLASYAAVRWAWVETWERDQQAYVLFPVKALPLYYVFRPLTYLDSRLTGMRFHIGPHH